MLAYTKPTRTAPNRRSGAAVVEFAVILPFLMFLCVIAIDWARLLHFSIQANDCARSGALYASDATSSGNSRYTNVRDAALAETPELAARTDVIVTSTTSTVNGSTYVTVKVEVPFQTITNFPGVPSSQTITRSVQMRVAPLVSR